MRFVSLALALLAASVLTIACSPRESSEKKNSNRLATAARPDTETGKEEPPKGGKIKTDKVDLGGGVKMELVWIPAGSFQMGSPQSEQDQAVKDGEQREWVSGEGPVHTVELDGFWMGKFEVTQEQYEAVMGKNPSDFKGEKNPVERVSWNDAAEFCQKASQKTGKEIRLPTEAEWEYACRAGTRAPFSSGETISTDQANYDRNYTYGSGRKGEYRKKTIQVGSFQPNEWGLYDMHGNVWEWCGDWYGEKYYGESDRKNPQGPSSGEFRVLRGGSWIRDPFHCRSATRYWSNPANTIYDTGFRVACVSRTQS